jgi:MFS family permease
MFGKRFEVPRWPLLVWVVLAGTLLTRTAFFMVWPFLAILLNRQFGLGPPEIGGILAGMALGTALVGFYSGNLSDRFGRRTLMIGGCVAAVVSYVTLAFATSVAVFAVGAFLVGLSRSSLEAPGKALIADRVAEAGPRELAYHARYFLINAGAAIGPLLGVGFGLAAQQATFLITGVVYGLFTLALFIAFHRSPEIHPGGVREEARLSRVVAVVGRDRAFLLLLVAMFLMLAAYSQQESTLVQYITLEAGDAAVGLVTALIATNALTIVIFQFPFLAWMSGMSLAARNYVGMALIGAGFLLYIVIPVASLPLWIVAVWILSMGESILFPTLNLQVDRMAPEQLKGSYFGAASLSGLGFSAGPLVGGILLEWAGGPATFAIMAALTGACAWTYLESVRAERLKETAGPVSAGVRSKGA